MSIQLLQQAQQILQSYFGYEEFRDGQLQAIGFSFSGARYACCHANRWREITLLSSTSLSLEGTTIVISPLISLMKDQVDMLVASGVHAAFINSSLSFEEVQDVMYGHEWGN